MEKYTKAKLQEMSDEAIVHAELQLDRDLVALRFQKKSGVTVGIHKSKQVRKNIARLRSEQRAREIAGNLEKDSLRETHRGSFSPAENELASQAVKGSSFASDLNEQMEEEE